MANIKNTSAYQTLTDLRNDMANVFESLRNGKIGLNEAKELANVSGKIMSMAKVQMEYNKMTNSKAKIEFLEDEEAKTN